jgi:hypothetical protein
MNQLHTHAVEEPKDVPGQARMISALRYGILAYDQVAFLSPPVRRHCQQADTIDRRVHTSTDNERRV